ncbi:hypothetical protein [Thiomicrorhabdus sp.]|uniref:hypothetical protein n=1 Tax=Thiomicrorhabdus sp. TaxID=2039724 RepID=UPI0029C7ECF8|nr:hypothetical protein [Thiomicrorhabdus sp.]
MPIDSQPGIDLSSRREDLLKLPFLLLTGFGFLLLMALAPWLDTQAEQYIDDALLNSGAIYATARAINALVSVLQSVEISVFFVSLDIGEILDPVNDLIERFSDVISFALASLALQKILLVISAHGLFKILLLLAALAYAAASLFGHFALRRISFRIFISLIFIRLAFATVILANTGIDKLFLQQQSEHNYQNMQAYQAQLNGVADLVKDEEEANQQQQQALRQQLETDSQQLARVTRQKAALQTQIDTQNAAIRQRHDQLGTISRFYNDDPQLKKLQTVLNTLKKQSAEFTEQIDYLEKQKADIKAQLLCLQKKARGESCGFADWFGSSGNSPDLKQKIIALGEDIEQFVDSTLQLLTLLLLKSILFPLLFWWMIYRVFKVIWSLELPHFSAPLSPDASHQSK